MFALKSMIRRPSGATKASPRGVEQMLLGAMVPVAKFMALTASVGGLSAASPVI
jgi:hypothetical protein